MPTKSSRPLSDTSSRAVSQRPSRALSVASSSGPENFSFVSHLSTVGHGVAPTGNYNDIAAAAAAITGTRRPRSEAPSAAADVLRKETPHPQGNASGSAAGDGGPMATTEAAMDSEAAPPEDASVFGIVKQFMAVGYPLTVSVLAQFSLNTVIVSVNGKMLGDVELGGASLAVGLVNATGFAFGAGLCGALETVLSQTYGAYELKVKAYEDQQAARKVLAAEQQAAAHGMSSDTLSRALPPGIVRDGAPADVDNDAVSDAASTLSDGPPKTLYMYGIYTQRMAVILFFVAFPLGAILCFADVALQAAGESSAVLYYTGIWCRFAVFGIPATMAYQLVQRYYASQRITAPLSVAMILAAVANPVLQVVFVLLFGFRGSPIAWLLLMTSIVGGLVGYLKYTGLYKLTWGGISGESLRGLRSLTAIAVPSMGVMLSEWVALEINALASGFAPTKQLAAFSITLQAFGLMWGIGSGVVILSCVFVGNAIGAGKPLLARRIAFIAIGLILCIALVDIVIFFSLGPIIPWLFTSDPEVVQIYHNLMYIVLPYHIVDTFQSTVMGILRGCGLQRLGALIICTAFCIVGVPLSFLLFFYFDIGVRALWIGPFFGVGAVATPAYIFILLRYIKWEELKPHEDGTVALSDMEDDMAGEVSSHRSGEECGVDDGGAAAATATSGAEAVVNDYVDESVQRAKGTALMLAR